MMRGRILTLLILLLAVPWARADDAFADPSENYFGWGHAKMLLAEKIDQHFAEARQRREHFVAHPEEVEAVLRRSAERARAEARRTIDACKQACGLS